MQQNIPCSNIDNIKIMIITQFDTCKTFKIGMITAYLNGNSYAS